MIHLLLTTLLALYPHSPASACVRSRAARIANDARAASEAHHVPATLLVAIGWFESHLGCNPRSGGSWGSPSGRAHRHRAGSAWHTARDLATSFRVCHSWPAAVARYRCGLCRCTPPVGYRPRHVLSLVRRLNRAWAATDAR